MASSSSSANSESNASAAYWSHLGAQPVLAPEVVKHQGGRDPGRGGDVADRHGVVPALAEQAQGRVADGGAGGEVGISCY